jgi:hypothetical protein
MTNPLDTLTPQDFLTELAAFRLELDRKQDIIAERDAEIERLRGALEAASPAVEFMASAIDADPEDEERLTIVNTALAERETK